MNAPSQTLAGSLNLPQPYLLFLGDVAEPSFAKTAFGLAHWASDRCVGELAIGGSALSVGLTPMTPAEAVAAGGKALVIGVANSGGVIPESWQATLVEALDAGLDIVSGLHVRLGAIPAIAEAAKRNGRRLIDVRTPPAGIPVGTGRKRSGKRLLAVGTDCAVGKKYTALAIHRAMAERGIDADFRATGQTGIMIAGGGIPMDAVISDFEAGAAEVLSPDAPAGHWDVIEGQGSLYHPAYAGVSTALLHGSQPDAFVICHDPSRTHVLGHPHFPLPDIEDLAELTIRLGRRTNPAIRCAGVSLNTSALGSEKALSLLTGETARLGMPVADPMRGGDLFDKLVESCLAE